MRSFKSISGLIGLWLLTLSVSAHKIHYAALMGDLVKLKMILGIDPQLVNARNNYGNTPLHYSAFCGREKTAEFLLDKGADINARNNKGKTPLFCAAAGGKEELVDLLLSNRADVNARDNENNTPLHYAVSKECLKIIRILLEHKANVNIKNMQGKTPLEMAKEKGYKNIIEILIANRVDSCIYEFSDQSVLMYPKSANVFDSLGEAYMKDGQKDLTVKNFRELLELNIENNNTREMLKKLCKKNK